MNFRPAPFGLSRNALLLGGLLAATTLARAAAADIMTLMQAPTPLVLKDGRIASVTVHGIPFEASADSLDAPTADALAAALAPLVTDCFLTAQAIGHVAPGADRDGDALSAHRLARARADHVQGVLAEAGVPMPSIASVWDWQFLVEKSQVTLWVFSLNPGDDCDGQPLTAEPVVAGEAAAPVVVTGPQALGRPRALTAADDLPAADGDEPSSSGEEASALVEPALIEPESVEPESVAEAEEALPAALTAADGPIRIWGPAAEAAAVEPEPSADAPPASVEAIVIEEAEAEDLEELDSAAVEAPVVEEEADLAITFAVNSSFFSDEARAELRRFLDGLPVERSVVIELAGAVGTDAVRGASADQSHQYNVWMAERRIERVADWLTSNAGGRDLTLRERLIENDGSRRVLVNVQPGET